MVGDDNKIGKFIELAVKVTEKNVRDITDTTGPVVRGEIDEEEPLCPVRDMELGSSRLDGKDSNVATKVTAIELVCDDSDRNTYKSHLKATVCYLIALIFSSLFLFIAFAEIYKSFALHSYHAEPYVVDYSRARPTPVGNSLATLGHYQTLGKFVALCCGAV
jgi:hypothetical protein